MTSLTSGARALDRQFAAAGTVALAPARLPHGPVRRIRPANLADRHGTHEGGSFVARPLVTAPDASRLRRRLNRAAELVGDRLGMPGRDVAVLAAAVAVVGSMFGTAMAVTSDPVPAHERQLEVQHAEWLAEQAQEGPVATMVTTGR